MGHNEFFGWGMGFSAMGILFWILLILAVAVVVKYLLGGPRA